jgi:predicted CXXCH cytochrome family protein
MSHAWRPLLVVVALLALLFVVRQIYVPGDFGVQESGYTYGWYREQSVTDWKWLTAKYQGKESCAPCHQRQVEAISDEPHSGIQCENCHGPALDHPSDPAKLTIDRTRELCLRCHARLPYPSSARRYLRAIDPASHGSGRPCVECHVPHEPSLGLQGRDEQGRTVNESCGSCHEEQFEALAGMPHELVYCETCHGRALDHPSDPPKLTIDKTRGLCLDCHVSKARHNLGRNCVTCHDPHKSSLQFLQFLP